MSDFALAQARLEFIQTVVAKSNNTLEWVRQVESFKTFEGQPPPLNDCSTVESHLFKDKLSGDLHQCRWSLKFTDDVKQKTILFGKKRERNRRRTR